MYRQSWRWLRWLDYLEWIVLALILVATLWFRWWQVCKVMNDLHVGFWAAVRLCL